MLCAARKGIKNELTRAEARCAHDVTVLFIYEGKPGSRSHLYDGSISAYHAVFGCNGFTQGARNVAGIFHAAEGAHDDIRGAVAAIRHGQGVDSTSGKDAPCGFRHRSDGFFRCQASLEFIRGKDNSELSALTARIFAFFGKPNG